MAAGGEGGRGKGEGGDRKGAVGEGVEGRGRGEGLILASQYHQNIAKFDLDILLRYNLLMKSIRSLIVG